MPYEFLAKNGLISQGNITATGSLAVTQNISASATGSFGIVGIGTTNPATKFVVATSGTGQLRIGDLGFTSNYAGISLNAGSSYNLLSSPTDSTLYINRPSGGNINFREANGDQVVLLSGGNVGIGSSSPSSKLEVLTSAVGLSNQPNIIGNFRGDTDGRSLIRVDNTSTSAGAAALQSGVSFVAYSNTSNQPSANKHEAQIILGSTGATSVSGGQTGTLQIVAPLDIAFNVSASNTIMTGSSYTTFGSNAMYLARSGNVGIGTTSPSYRLDVVSGSMRVSSDANSGEIYFGNNNNVDLYLKRDNNYDLSLVQNAASANGLYLAGAGNVYVSIDSNDNSAANAFIVQNNAIKSGTELFRVQENGNVGIGTTVPISLIDVNGSSRHGSTASNVHQFTGSVNINGNLTASNIRSTGTSTAAQLAEKVVTFTPLTGSLTENPAWYRLISGSGILDSGRVRLSANYDNSRSDIEFTYAVRNYDTDGAGAFINITRASTYNSLFNAIRVIEGTSITPYAIDVLIGNYLNNTSPATVTCLYESQFISAVLDTPTYVSASATGSNSNVVKTVYTTYTSGYPRIGPAYSDGLAVATYQGQLSVGYRGNYSYNVPSSNNYALLVSGSVGIGTTTLGEKLTVSGNSYIIGSTGAVGTGLAYYLGDSSNRDISLTRAGTAALAIGRYYPSAWAETVRFTADGNVGIGTSSPNSKLEVAGSSGTAIISVNNTTLGRSGSFGIDGSGVFIRNSSDGDYFDLKNASGVARFRVIYDNATHLTTNFVSIGNLSATGSKLSVFGNTSIGSTYGSTAAPTNGLIVEGNVGIGSTVPGAKLDVVGDLRVKSAGPAIILDTTTTSDGRMEYKYNGTRKALIGVDSDNLQIAADSGNYLQFRTNNTQRMIINNSGGVGIGTSSPLYLFDLYDTGANSAMMSLRSSGSGNARIYFDAANGDLVGSDYCYIGQDDSTLNFVINTANVAGDIHLQPKWNTSNGKLIVSGSSQFGLSPSSTHQFTGSVIGNFTSSRSVGVGFLGTASWATNATTAASLSSMNVSQFTNDSKYHYHRTDISSLSSSATNIVQPVSTFDYNNATNGPTNAWYNYFSSTHGDYLTSLIANRHRSADWYVAYKEGPGGTPTNPSWYLLLHTGNYNTYAPTLTGTGASGTWSITSSMANALNSGNSYTVGSLTSTVQASGATGTLVSYVTPGIYALGSSTGNGIGLISNTSFANQGAIANIGLHQITSSVNDITAGVYMSIGGWHQNSGTGLPVYIGGGYTSNSSSILSVVPTNTAGAGNVGIGTRLPGYKLDVNGDIRAMSGSTIRLQTSAGQERGTFQATDTTGAGGAGLAIATSGGEEIAFKDSADVNMVIKGTGRVGIGTITPAEMLHISSSNNTQLRLESGADAAVQFVGPDTHSYAIGMDDSDDKFKISYNASRTPPGLGTNDRLVITTAGNIGIGATSPSALLHVSDSTSEQVRVQSTGTPTRMRFVNNAGTTYNSYIGADTLGVANVGLIFQTGNSSATTRMVVDVNGKVGIGTTIPTSSLDIIGDIKASSSTINILGNLDSLRGNVSTYGYNLTGSPSGTGWISVQTFHNALSSGDILSQLAYDNYNQQKLFTRYSADYGATWSSWKTIINSDALSGTINYIPKFTGTNSIGNSAIYDSGGNVGIATTAPGAPLDVVGQPAAAILRTTTAISTSYAGLRVYNNLNVGTRALEIDYAGSSYAGSLVTNGPTGESACVTTTGAYPLVLGTSNTARMTILGNGNVGIGSASPAYKLDVAGGDVNFSSSTILRFGTVAVLNTASSPNDIYANIRVLRNESTVNTDGMYIGYNSNGTTAAHLRFYANGTNERMRIDASNGNVGIGITNPAAKLSVTGSGTGQMLAGDAGFSVGNYTGISVNGTLNTTAYNILSSPTDTNLYINRPSGNTIYFRESNNDQMVLLTGGNLGIGTTNPSAKVQISGSANSVLLNVKSPISGNIVYVTGSGAVGINTTTPAYTLQVNGSFAATTKSFVIDHPTKPDKKLVYGSLESPYHGIRLTGRDTLVDGKCVVDLPDYISKLIMPETVNIQLTGIKCNKTLYVDDINIKENNFTVAYDKGVFESYKDYDFFWDFTAVRADVPELQTEM